MQPYVIRQGDFLALLAYRFDFDPDTIWNDPANAEIQQNRSDPNQLWPTDMLQIPNPASAPKTHTLNSGQTNSFTSDSPSVDVSLKFTEDYLASKSFTIPELPQLTGLTTDSEGSVTLSIPLSQATFSIVFDDDDTTFAFKLGHLDPVNTFSGIVHRLQNLGYLDPDADYGLSDIDEIRIALLVLKSMQSSEDDAGDDDDAASSDSGGDDPPESASGGDAKALDSMYADSADDSGDDDAPPDPPDNGGMDDDGSLDDETQQVLLDAYGC